MFDLSKQEKIILIFLSASFVTGLGIKAYQKSQQGLALDVRAYQLDTEKTQRFIAEQELVNINSLEPGELTRLPGVGEKLAFRIISYHKLHGPFTSKQELIQVEGIGKKKFELIKDSISLK